MSRLPNLSCEHRGAKPWSVLLSYNANVTHGWRMHAMGRARGTCPTRSSAALWLNEGVHGLPWAWQPPDS